MSRLEPFFFPGDLLACLAGSSDLPRTVRSVCCSYDGWSYHLDRASRIMVNWGQGDKGDEKWMDWGESRSEVKRFFSSGDLWTARRIMMNERWWRGGRWPAKLG
ncbi:hypothetical protein C8Q69DRAFT_501316 [Paecilomyces variotii]|uniref:Uncharacterized protein n=1 Tax=Byssochlamys spectabilis TaxID=264951 RepID=A0A443HKY0_BYSSP|nr:hypothetical protein C8Q69DRAFT_501316 [Paecilomyces variotii]RWQ92462.1 hypothetical protein C8Q69DRAFT_501316 [Paecilomyces variotii]